MVAEMADHVADTVAKMIISTETTMIPMRKANLLRNDFYLHPHRLQGQ